MAKFVKHFSFVMVLIVLISAICMPISAEAATAKGTISSVTNTASGVTVKWTKDSAKTGYYIYRKAGSSSTYKKVKTVKGASTTSWTDTNVTNGTKYVYKVRSYKGSAITTNNTAKTIYRMVKPTVTASRASGTSINVKASNAKATGFQIRYSTKSDFSTYKTVTVAGTSLNKTIKSLAKNTKYYVKVRAYKTVSSKKYYGAFSAVKSATTYNVDKAIISSLTRAGSTSINVKASDAKATGFQIRYSTKSDFSSYKSVSVSGTNLNKTITGLTKGTKYYVKVRAYKTVNDTKIYGAFSDAKNVVTYYTAYPINTTTALYIKPTSTSDYKTVYYMQPVTIYEQESSTSKGEWRKVLYDGVMYYCWQDGGVQKFTTEKDTYDHYTEPKTTYQQAVVDYAVEIMKTKATKYVKGGVGENIDGKLQFDCSGFASHVLNTVMQEYIPVYKLSSNLATLHDRRSLYNQGFDSEFNAKVLCENTIDWSKLQPGDIVFFNEKYNTDHSKENITHCGIYLGDKQFVHSTRFSDGVSIMPLDKGFYYDGFICAIRYLPEPDKVQPINQIVHKTSGSASLYKDIGLNTSIIEKENLSSRDDDLTLEYYNATYSGAVAWASVMYNGQRYYVYNPSTSLSPFLTVD